MTCCDKLSEIRIYRDSVCREVICINIGQAGVQLSNAAWELFCIEHGIQANGKLMENIDKRNENGFQTFFEEIRGNQYVPRTVTIDLEPTVIDEVRNGPYRNLFHPDQLISSCEDAANNYARGYHSVGKLLLNQVLDRIRKCANNCENLQGFFLNNSLGGGTGSGFTSLLLSKLGVEYAKRTKFQVAIYPGTQLSNSVVEPYNTLMSFGQMKDSVDVSILMDNESLYDICGLALDIARPTYNNINRLIAQVFSAVTVSLRFENSLNNDLAQLATNLVPYPIIHFLLANYAPILSDSRAEHQDMSTREITRALFEPFCQMARCNVTLGRYISCGLQYRGDVTPRDVNEAIFEVKRRTDIQFVDWCPTGFKLSINCQPPVSVVGSEMSQTQRSVTMLANTSAITQVFSEMFRKYDVLFAKRAFVHWYVSEGMEEGEFSAVRQQVSALERDYEEICSSPDDEDDEETGDNTADRPTEASTPEPVETDGGGEEDNESDEQSDDNIEQELTENSAEIEDIF